MIAEVDSNMIFERYTILWRLQGFFHKNPRPLLRAYRLFLIIGVTIFYPIYLMICLLFLSDSKEIFANLMILVGIANSSVKHFLYYPQFKRMNDINRLLHELDRHVLTKEDREFHQKNIHLITERLLYSFVFIYESCCLSILVMWLIGEQSDVTYPVWFPFNWKSSSHTGAVFFEWICYQVIVIQDLASDIYVPIGLCILSGQTQLLAKRLQRIGYDEDKSENEHYADLTECVEDYIRLMRVFSQIQETITWNMLLQSVAVGVHLVFSLMYIIFFAEKISEYGVSIGMICALVIEFYPSCYYGSCVEKSFHDLTSAMFSCNWQHRSQTFQRSLTVFTEFTLRPITMYAMQIVKIHLDTYFGTMRLAYSLFCVVLRLK